MENPAKFLCQNKSRDMNDKTMKAIANDILAKCQEQELSYDEMHTLFTALRRKNEECRQIAMNAATAQKAEIKTF